MSFWTIWCRLFGHKPQDLVQRIEAPGPYAMRVSGRECKRCGEKKTVTRLVRVA